MDGFEFQYFEQSKIGKFDKENINNNLKQVWQVVLKLNETQTQTTLLDWLQVLLDPT
jgi:hypothetical protein